MYESAPAPAVPIWVQGPVLEPALSTLNPVSFVELSSHERLICDEDAALAARLDGAAGTVADASVVALVEFE
jgi:hypothetical protein